MGSLNTLILKVRRRARPHGAPRGFTLLELLVVLVIAGLTMGFVTANMMQGERQALQNDAQRVALLLQLARDEAIVRNRPIAFEADSAGYRFLVRDGANWALMAQEELLRQRAFNRTPVALSISPSSVAEENPLRIVFGREPVDKPFLLTFATGESSVAIRADGIGHFVVE